MTAIDDAAEANTNQDAIWGSPGFLGVRSRALARFASGDTGSILAAFRGIPLAAADEQLRQAALRAGVELAV